MKKCKQYNYVSNYIKSIFNKRISDKQLIYWFYALAQQIMCHIKKILRWLKQTINNISFFF